MYAGAVEAYTGLIPQVTQSVPSNEETLLSSKNLEDLARNTRAVADLVNLMKPDPAHILPNCSIDSTAIVSNISLSESVISFERGDTASKTIVISGSSGRYVFTTSSGNLELRQPLPFGPVLEVGLSSAATAGNYYVIVQDISGKQVSLQVAVKEPEPASR